jgi:hypothetical protein
MSEIQLPKLIYGKPKSDYSYCYLLMKGDSYLPGVYISAYSLGSIVYDISIMVTNDVSSHAIDMLKKIATCIFLVPYLNYESKPLKTVRQRELYSSWISSSYTKWNALALPYKKVLLLDADTIALSNKTLTCESPSNIDDLFNLNTPAAVFASPFCKPLGKLPCNWSGPKGPDGYLIHNTTVKYKEIERTLNKGHVLPSSNPFLLSPSISDYNSYISMMDSSTPFGFPHCNNGHDEQSIALFYKCDWTNIHHKYNYISWKDGYLKDETPMLLHYFSDSKPWNNKYDLYPDIITWYKMALSAINYTKIKPSDINIKEKNLPCIVEKK